MLTLLLIVSTNSFLALSVCICFNNCRYVFTTHMYLLTIDHMAFVLDFISRIYSYFICLYFVSRWFCYICFFPSSKYYFLIYCYMARIDNFQKYFQLSPVFINLNFGVKVCDFSTRSFSSKSYILQYYLQSCDA